MALHKGVIMHRWNDEQDEILIKNIEKASENNISLETAFMATCEEIFNLYAIERTSKSVGLRYRALKNSGQLSDVSIKRTVKQEEESNDFDLAGVFGEMRKIIRERDDYKTKYEDALLYKNQYIEVKKENDKFKKEYASFMDFLGKKA